VTGARRALSIAAVVATLVGLPAVLVAGALLRHVGHVAPSVQNAAGLRLRLLGHDMACDLPEPESDPDPAASALLCLGPGGVGLRLTAYRNEAAERAAPVNPGWYVSGANWRVQIVGLAADSPTGERLAARLARALTGRAARASVS
jgi:hypothetical protein